MELSLDYILENQDQTIKEAKHQTDIFNIQESFRGLNNQNRIIRDFKKCKAFLKYNRVTDFYHRLPHGRERSDMWKIQNRLWMIPQEGHQQTNMKLAKMDPKDITFNDLEPYIKYHSWHTSVDIAAGKVMEINENTDFDKLLFPTRWGDIRYIEDHERTRKGYAHVFKAHKDLTELLKQDNVEWDKHEFYYHDILGVCHSMYQIGLGEIGLELIKPFLEIWKREYKGRSVISHVMPPLFQDYKLRILGSITWPMAFSYYQIGDEESYYNTLKYYVDFWEDNRLGHYLVENRVLEAAILVYKHKPTQENKDKLLYIFHETCKIFMDEPTECARERGLIVFDLIQTLFKKEYEEYNS